MKVVQAMGPFFVEEEKPISFNVPESGVKYIKIGIQAPHASPLEAFLLGQQEDPPNFKNYMIKFKIDNKEFIINGNGILEFEDLDNSRVFEIQPLQDMDAYTIIDIAFIDEESA